MKVEIRYLRFTAMFGRTLAFGQLYSVADEPKLLQDGSLAQILTTCTENKFNVVNAQEILTTLVLKGGFAS